MSSHTTFTAEMEQVSPDFRQLFESAPDMYLVLTPELRIVAASDAYLRATMTTREQVLGRYLFDVFPDNPAAPSANGVKNLKASLEQVLKTRSADVKTVQKYDIPRPDAKGGGFEERYWSPLNSPVIGRDGSVEYIIHRVEDVTEFVFQQQDLSEDLKAGAKPKVPYGTMAAKLFRRGIEVDAAYRKLQVLNGEMVRLMEAIPEAFFEVDAEGRILVFNEAAQTMFGYTSDEFLGMKVEMLVPAGQREAHVQHRAAYAQNPKRRTMGSALELRAQRKDGSIFAVELCLSPKPSAAGLNTIALCRDVTERKHTEEILHQSEERFRSIFEQSPIGFSLIGLDSRFIKASPAFCHMLDYTEEELTGMTPLDITHPDDRGMSANILEHLRTDQGTTDKLEKRYVKKNGEIMWGIVGSSVIRDRNGTPLYWLGMIEDITKRKRTETQLAEHQAQLESSARLASLGMMAGGVAHEINNPLAVIHASAANLLRLAEENENVPREAVTLNSERIRQTADRIAKIVKSLRRIARDGSHDPLSPTSISKIVEASLEACKERFRQHSVSLFLPEVDPDLCVCCREVQIAQVLLNLLQNAFDAVTEQAKEKWVRMNVTTKDGWAVFSVIDSGAGVPADIRTRIMEPFFTTKEVGKGTGLGLSLSRKIIEEHGGELELTEEAGHTCFAFRLPLAQTPEALCC